MSSISSSTGNTLNKAQVLIVSNYIPDDVYAECGSTHEEWEETTVARIKVMVNLIAPELLGGEGIDYRIYNIAETTEEELLAELQNTRLAVFTGGPQNIRNTKDEHLVETERLQAILKAALAQIESGELPDLRLITLCLSHQALGHILQMEVVQNENSEFKRGFRNVQLQLQKSDTQPPASADKSDFVQGMAFHKYHVKFRNTTPEEKLQAVEFATLKEESWCKEGICYGMLVLGPQGDVRIVSTQFHPEASFCATVDAEARERMAHILVDAFQSRVSA